MSIEKLGWREWVTLPELNIARIKAKVDTGAKTSALHAFFVEPYSKDGQEWVRFGMHPNQGDNKTELICHARVVELRNVTDSGGHQEQRYVILTSIELAELKYSIELTLTNRDTMRFRMLLGRGGIPRGVIVDPHASYLIGK